MKKFFSRLAIISSILLASQANAADGFYAGADLLWQNTKYKRISKIPDPAVSAHVGKIDGNDLGIGAVVGYKKYFEQVFIAPEIFYDYLNSEVKDYYHITPRFSNDTLEIRDRYGIKLNLGYDFNKFLAGYLTYGAANINYISRSPTLGFSQNKPELSQIYGIGALFNFSENWAFKVEFNQQKFRANYGADGNGVVSAVRLNVLKTGVVYSF